MRYVDLGGVHSCAQFTAKLRLAAQGTENGHWILGSNWNNENWGGELPKASWIDSATVSHPVSYNKLHVAIRSLLMTSSATLQQPIGVSMRKDYGPSGKIDSTVGVRSRH
jgi:predicted amidohydrolase YtcJ